MKLPRSSRLRELEFRARGTPAARSDGNGQLGAPDKSSKPPRPDKAQRRKLLREYVAWLWPHWPRILFILILSLIVMALDMVWPLGIKWIIDAAAIALGVASPMGATPGP